MEMVAFLSKYMLIVADKQHHALVKYKGVYSYASIDAVLHSSTSVSKDKMTISM